jgi:hypothetical protein
VGEQTGVDVEVAVAVPVTEAVAVIVGEFVTVRVTVADIAGAGEDGPLSEHAADTNIISAKTTAAAVIFFILAPFQVYY